MNNWYADFDGESARDFGHHECRIYALSAREAAIEFVMQHEQRLQQYEVAVGNRDAHVRIWSATYREGPGMLFLVSGIHVPHYVAKPLEEKR